MIHELKTDPEPFDAVAEGRKLFEIRKCDRPFDVLDVLHLRRTTHSGRLIAEGKPLIYSGAEALVRVVGIMHGPYYGLVDGWCIMSILMLEQDWKPIGRERIERYLTPPPEPSSARPHAGPQSCP